MKLEWNGYRDILRITKFSKHPVIFVNTHIGGGKYRFHAILLKI